DHYKTMDIARDSTEAQIRKAYKKMSLKHHPDKHNNSEASTIAFQKLNEANCILSDPDKRHDYNKL
ncbi:DnaJ domain-containing protein, partial [Leptodontidium sp. 2 PMI_412]